MSKCYFLIGQNLKKTLELIQCFYQDKKTNIAFSPNNSDLYQKIKALPYKEIEIHDFTTEEVTLHVQESNLKSAVQTRYMNQINSENHLIFHSSGSVDGLKWIFINKKNLDYVTENIFHHLGLKKTDHIGITAPLFHSFGMNIGILTCERYDIPYTQFSEIPKEKWIDEIAKDKFTHIYGVPTIWEMLKDKLNSEDLQLKNLRGGIIGGAKVNKDLFDYYFYDQDVKELTVGYGLTECSPILTHTNPGEGLATDGEIGKPFTETEIIFDNDELQAKGPQVAKFISSFNENGFQITRQEVCKTGDLVKNQNGFLIYQGRVAETIERGGEKISLDFIQERLTAELSSYNFEFKCYCASSDDPRFNNQIGIAYKSLENFSEQEFQEIIKEKIVRNFGRFFGNISFLKILNFPINNTGKYIRKESELLKRRVA